MDSWKVLLVHEDESMVHHFPSQVSFAGSVHEGLSRFYEKRPDVIFIASYFKKEKVDGVHFLKTLKREAPYLPVLIVFSCNQKNKFSLFKEAGAFDCIDESFSINQIMSMIEHALSYRSPLPRREVMFLGSVSQKRISEVKSQSHSVIVGPMGSHKSYVAELLAEHHPFLLIRTSCEQYEKNLFGYVIEETALLKHGALEEAHGGSIYIEDIKDLSKRVQKLLVDFFLSKQFSRLGESKKHSTNVKLIFGSSLQYHELLPHMLPEFLSMIWTDPLILIPLKDRPQDIKKIFEHYCIDVSNEALKSLAHYDWPFDLQELLQYIDRFVLEGKHQIGVGDLPVHINCRVLPEEIFTLNLKEAREAFEKLYIEYHMKQCFCNLSKVATKIGMNRSALHRKMKGLINKSSV